ncbi:MAG: hypothetical protein JWP78_108 [Mucilaginibacter sp.]|nr:hypothetical protein [Mucilaginibacter sp.]
MYSTPRNWRENEEPDKSVKASRVFLSNMIRKQQYDNMGGVLRLMTTTDYIDGNGNIVILGGYNGGIATYTNRDGNVVVQPHTTNFDEYPASNGIWVQVASTYLPRYIST